jgi:DUF971 family protein
MELKKISRLKSEDNLSGTGISITFQDLGDTQHTLNIPSNILRRECPCASCQQRRGDTSHETPLTGQAKKSSLLKVIHASSEEEYNLEKIWLLGNYAIGMKWADGHDSGIYTFPFLKELAEKTEYTYA